MRMSTLTHLLMLTANAPLLSIGAAAADDLPSCGQMICETKKVCHIEVFPCGEEPDGTVFFCPQDVCEPVTECHPVTPCVGESSPDSPDFPDIPDLPDIPDSPDFPTL